MRQGNGVVSMASFAYAPGSHVYELLEEKLANGGLLLCFTHEDGTKPHWVIREADGTLVADCWYQKVGPQLSCYVAQRRDGSYVPLAKHRGSLEGIVNCVLSERE